MVTRQFSGKPGVQFAGKYSTHIEGLRTLGTDGNRNPAVTQIWVAELARMLFYNLEMFSKNTLCK